MQGHNHERATGITADNDQEIGRQWISRHPSEDMTIKTPAGWPNALASGSYRSRYELDGVPDAPSLRTAERFAELWKRGEIFTDIADRVEFL